MSEAYALRVNGTEHVVVDGLPGESLLYVLRERLGLAGAKAACEQGECGSCSVVIDGELLCSCLVLAESADGCTIDTVERHTALSAVQAAFVDAGAVQCGFCTPGLVVAIEELLASRPADAPVPDDLAVREAISGNLCRCTGYGRILEAVRRAAAAGRVSP